MTAAAYGQFTDEQDLARRVEELSAKTAVFDVEPLVATWDSSLAELDQGVARVLELVTAVPGLLVVCFATNSARQPSVIPQVPGVRVLYLASARKPLRTGPYADLPRPGIVIGDQVPTDGVLAKRLGYAFLHYRHLVPGTPFGPRLMNGCGQLLRPFVFGR